MLVILSYVEVGGGEEEDRRCTWTGKENEGKDQERKRGNEE